MLRTVGYTFGSLACEGVRGREGGTDADSRSATAWLEDLEGTDVSSVALGTEVEDVCCAIVLWSSEAKP